MSIFPLPVFETESDPKERLDAAEAEAYEAIEPPKTIVVRYGFMKLIGEFRYDGEATPGCGSKLVVRTNRGTEMAEMLTTTCANAGCGKSITRKEMLDYIERSGGKSFPFNARGRVLRIATVEDMNRHSALVNDRAESVRACKETIERNELDMKLVDVEPILGGELMTIFYMSESRVDFRELVKDLAARFRCRIEMRQVGARDEARLVADYERCGQHCCCKQFLKVLKPVSMKSAKVQKATLDPLKISGRCGRLMCCLRYEDQTYKELKASLPRKNTRVGTVEGPGTVIDGKILTQLVLVRLEDAGREVAYPVEELLDPEESLKLVKVPEPDPFRGKSPDEIAQTEQGRGKRGRRGRRRRSTEQVQDEQRAESQRIEAGDRPDADEPGDRPRKRRRRRRKRGGGGGDQPAQASGGGHAPDGKPDTPRDAQDGDGQRGPRRRRRRRRRGGSGGGGGSGDKPAGD